MSILARRQVRLAAFAALSTIPGVTLVSPGDWETPAATLPEIKLKCGTDRKQSIARAAPEFTTTITLELLARVEAATDVAAQDAIELLGESIEESIFGNSALVRLCQQFTNVNTTTEISSDGRRHLAGLQMTIDCELFESFEPTEIVKDTLPALTSLEIHLDTANPFDPTATYPNPAFSASVTAAPRTSGPDGRDEAALRIPL